MYKIHILLGAFAVSIATMVVVITTNKMPSPVVPQERSDNLTSPHFSAPEIGEVSLEDDETLGSLFTRYENETYNYGFVYPSNWSFDDSGDTYPGHVLTDPSKHVYITIDLTKDPEMETREGQKYIMESIKESVRFDPTFELMKFEHRFWKEHSTLITEGIRRLGNHQWIVEEYNIFRDEHLEALNVNISVRKDSEHLYRKAIDSIIESMSVCHV